MLSLAAMSFQVGIYEYIDETTSQLTRKTDLNDADINLDNNNVFSQALRQLSQAASSGSSAVVIPTTNVGSGQQTNPQESPNKEEEEQDTTSLQSFKSRRHYRRLSFFAFMKLKFAVLPKSLDKLGFCCFAERSILLQSQAVTSY